MHPEHGVEGLRLPLKFLPVLTETDAGINLKENAGRAGRYAHRFMAIPRSQLKLRALSAYIRLAEQLALAVVGSDVDREGARNIKSYAVSETIIEAVSTHAMRTHLHGLTRAEIIAMLPPRAEGLIGTEDLAFAPVPLSRGCMVLWDSCIPHHNLAAALTNTRPRLSAYVDMAPATAGLLLAVMGD